MSVRRETQVSLASLSTFCMGGVAEEVVTLQGDEDLRLFFTTTQQWHIIGEGSNTIFPDGVYTKTLVRLAPSGIRILEEHDDTVLLEAGGGEKWDDVVSFAVAEGLSGIEALSAIPGTAGATPVQNVGAYGVEIADVLVSLRAFDTKQKEFVVLKKDECGFSYRNSIFKSTEKGRYCITSITLALSKKDPIIPAYPGVAEYFAEKGITHPGLEDIREAITTIRWKKLPDPKDIASVGSFFKNPIVTKEVADAITEKHPKVVSFPLDDTYTKLGAGSLIDALGWKGKSFGPICIYPHNALVLVHSGGGTREELQTVIDAITTAVMQEYGVVLEVEPELL